MKRTVSEKKRGTFHKNLAVTVTLFVAVLLLMTPSAYGQENFAVKDSGGATLFSVTETGNVGIGTETPDQLIHVNKAQNGITALRVENSNILGGSAPLAQEQFVLGPNGNEHMMLQVLSDTNPSLPRVALINAYTHDFYVRTNAVNVFKIIRTSAAANTLVLTAGKVGIGTATPTHLIHLSGGAYSDGAVWTNASSRELKENITDLSTEEANSTLQGLTPVKYNYKTDAEDRHVGFIAEDVPDLVATKDRKGLSPMDIVAVLTKVVQEKSATVDALVEKLNKLEAEVNRLKNRDMTAKANVQ